MNEARVNDTFAIADHIEQNAKLTIPTSLSGHVPFGLYPYQLNLINTLEANDRVVINKARQIGLTSILLAYAHAKGAGDDDFSVLWISHSRDYAKGVCQKFAVMFSDAQIDASRRSASWGNSKMEFCFGNINSVQSLIVGRRQPFDLVIMDEAAFFSSGALQLLQVTEDNASKFVIVSTPGSSEPKQLNEFKILVVDAAKHGFVPITLPWYVNGRGLEFYDTMASFLPGVAIDHELNCFLGE